jgi:hypothetical protein
MLTRGGGVGGGRGAESYDRKKAWSSLSHAILSAVQCTVHIDYANHKVNIRIEEKSGECICPLSWSVYIHHNVARDGR